MLLCKIASRFNQLIPNRHYYTIRDNLLNSLNYTQYKIVKDYPTTISYQNVSAAMFFQKVNGTIVSDKYGYNMNNYPLVVQQKILNMQVMAWQCNLDLSNLKPQNLLIDNNNKIWIIRF